MTRTFLIAIGMPPDIPPAQVAADLEDELLTSGYDVVSVKPWAGHDGQAAPVVPQIPLV
jgi:hypothetical protein